MDKFISIKENHEFRRIYQKGKSRVSPLLVTYAMRNRTGTPRMAVVSSKKIGNAVCRNRARRVVRAALRNSDTLIPKGWDVVFVCRAKTVYVKSTALVPVIRNHIAKLFSDNGTQ